MASTVATQTPAAPSRLGSFFGALGLLRESPIGMLGAAILLFWVTMAILEGKTQVIDLDLAAYFDTVRHDLLLGKVARRVQDV